MSPRLEPNQILHGDCREVLKTLTDASVDSIVTDPPAGIDILGRDWDDPDSYHGGQGATGRFADRDNFILFMEQVLRECLRVLKPGGHMFVWAIPRTSHWTATAIENAGFEVRDCIYHCYGAGFPKSLNVSKAIDKMAGAKREVIGTYRVGGNALTPTSEKGGTYGVGAPNSPAGELTITKPATPEAVKWDGWGTALKPAVECWWLCRKPIEEANVSTQVLKTGTGAINIDGTRVLGTPQIPSSVRSTRRYDDRGDEPELSPPPPPNPGGRWPANLVLSHAEGCRRVGEMETAAPVINRFTDGMKPFGEGAGHPYETVGGGTETVPVFECVEGCPVRVLNEQGMEMGVHRAGSSLPAQDKWDMADSPTPSYSGGFNGPSGMRYGDDGGASRFFQNFEPDVPFFYSAKAARSEKEDGLEDGKEGRKNTHPTVKPISLMRYLVRMVTPKGGMVLDPFAGSGTTLIAAVQEGMNFIGIEREEAYLKIARQRVGVAADRAGQTQAERDVFDLMMALGDE